MTLASPVSAANHAGADPGAPGRPKPALPQPALLEGEGTQVRLRDGAPETPAPSALSWLVADADSGEVLAAHDAHAKLPPASTLKTLFALTALPAVPSGAQHTVTQADLAGIGEGSSLVGVVQGHTYQVSDLWRGVFLNSGNDAVHVLAALNGGWQQTADKMQTKAHALGALDTHVVSPDGYDADGQVSSAYDLAVFGRAGLRNPDFARYCSTAQSTFPGNDGASFGIANTNRLLTGADGVQRYPGLVGIKNGYTTNAGNTLVAAAKRNGHTILVTLMHPQQGGGFEVYEEARQLLDWGFDATGHVDPVGSLDALRPVAHETRVAAPPQHAPTRPHAAPVTASAAASASEWQQTAGLVAAGVGLSAAAVATAVVVRRRNRLARG
ncbi:serine hydrolase [Streptomyces sp. NPDC046985]|uniref:D-alanyl-D-alanine carboxypeptidase family protein n=1 Tax=Streptomyces sp. NPDC046985 TaxID=3155377 RepID=UPI0033FDB6A4